MYIPHDSIQDVNMRWGDCVVRVRSSNGMSPLYVHRVLSVDSGRIAIEGSIRKGTNWVPVNTRFDLEDIVTTHPKMGYVNRDKHALLMRRVARYRQYHLGFCASRVMFRPPNTEELLSIGLSATFNVLDSINYLYDRKYTDIQKAVSDVWKGNVYSSAVSSTVAIGLSGRTAGPGVYRNNHLIGGVISETCIELPYPHKYFREELEHLGFEVKLVGVANGKETE